MYAKVPLTSARLLVGAAAAVCTLFAGNVVAEDTNVTISVPVNFKGLELSQQADARRFYIRLKNAAWLVCTRGTRVDLLPVYHLQGCYEKALGDAVHATNKPLVTEIYLATHTLQEAEAHGIDVPAKVVAK
jgi:UrcA family protein